MIYVIATIVLLGVLITVHEIGHFLAARLMGVQVITFSLGFGPKLLKKNLWGTEFVLSLIPLGGYVKMFGDEFGKECPPEDKKKGYLSQSVPRKILIALAGPTANVVFAVVMFALLSFVGRDHVVSKVGSVFEGSYAHTVGFRSFDTILSVNGHPTPYGKDVLKALKPIPDTVATFKVQRTIDGNTDTLQLTTQVQSEFGMTEYGEIKPQGTIPGLEFFVHRPSIQVIGTNSWAQGVGLRDDDIIVTVGRHRVRSLEQVEPSLASVLEAEKPFSILVERQGKPITLRAQPLGEPFKDLHTLGLAPSELKITRVMKRSPAEKTDLRSGDVLLHISGDTLAHFQAFREKVQTYGKLKKPMPLTVDRNGQLVSVSIQPEALDSGRNKEQPWHQMNYPFAVGISAFSALKPQTVFVRVSNPFVAMGRGFSQTWEWSKRFGVGLVKLVTGKLSVKMLSGPIYIGKIAGDWLREGLRQFMFLIALISLNLGLINLVPIPILDGGHVVFFLLEAVMRRPPSAKFVERAYKVGFAMIILLTVFVLFNDLAKILK